MSEAEATINCMNAVRIKIEAKSNTKKNSASLTSELMALLCVLNGKNHIVAFHFWQNFRVVVPFDHRLLNTTYDTNSFLGREPPIIKSIQPKKKSNSARKK